MFPHAIEEPLSFYLGLFPRSKKLSEMRREDGSLVGATFELDGEQFLAIAGEDCEFNMSTSLMVVCDTQEEIDRYWEALSEGGGKLACGWVRDRFGVFWQVEPQRLFDMIESGTPEQRLRVLEAVWSMEKIEIAKLEAAFEGREL